MKRKTAVPAFRGHFEVSGSNLTDQGVRLRITDRLIRSGVKWGSIDNIGRRTLLIKLGGSEEEVIGHYETIKTNFERWLHEDISDTERLNKKIANPGVTFTEFIPDKDLEVLRIDLHSHGLQCQQLAKGVDVFGAIHQSIGELSKVNEGLMKVNSEILKELSKRNY